MSQASSDPEIARLLKELESPDEAVRLRAVEELAQRGVSDPEVIRALEQVANFDSSPKVGGAATAALTSLRGQTVSEPEVRTPVLTPAAPRAARRGRKKYVTVTERLIDFSIGFLAWFAVNGLIWFIGAKLVPPA